jgi:hypothetical protein
MNQTVCRKLGAQIASRLIMDGVGKKAVRLILEYPGRNIDGTSWVEEAVAGQIEKVLLTASPEASARPRRRSTRTKAPS